MKKRILSICLAVLICISVTSCGKSDNTTNQAQNKGQQTESTKKSNNTARFEEFGFEYTEPKEWINYVDNNNLNFNLTSIEANGGKKDCIKMIKEYSFLFDVNKSNQLMNSLTSDSSKEELEKMSKEYQKLLKSVCEIVVVDRTINNKTELEKEFSKYECREKIGSQRNFDYYLIYNNRYDDKGLTDEAKKAYKDICDHIKDIKTTIKTFNFITEDEKMAKYKKIKFNAKTIDDKEISSNIFSGKRLTMINIWATFCGPCIEEMPELEKLYQEVKNEKVNVISVVADISDEDEDTKLLAKEIIKKKGVTFISIIPDENLKKGILKDISGYPTTIFVDSKGNIVGDYIVGSGDKGRYKTEIDNILKTLK